MQKILIIEDNPNLREELAKLLAANSYHPVAITTFVGVTEQALSINPDLILLDLTLPGISGQKILQQIRETSTVPIIMLTGHSTELNEILSLSHGADDFIAKPYRPQILLLHIEAVLSRTQNSPRIATITHNDITINPENSTLTYHDQDLTLTRNGLLILTYLIRHANKIVPRSELIDHCWDEDQFIDDNTLTVNINRLREELSAIGLDQLIETRRNQGYIIA